MTDANRDSSNNDKTPTNPIRPRFNATMPSLTSKSNQRKDIQDISYSDHQNESETSSSDDSRETQDYSSGKVAITQSFGITQRIYPKSTSDVKHRDNSIVLSAETFNKMKSDNEEKENYNQLLEEGYNSLFINRAKNECYLNKKIIRLNAKLKLTEKQLQDLNSVFEEQNENVGKLHEENVRLKKMCSFSQNYVINISRDIKDERIQVGSGRFSNVYLVTLTKDNAQVVLKEYKHRFDEYHSLDIDPRKIKKVWRKFKKEILINSLLRHPFVLKFIGYGDTSNPDSYPSLLFEFAANGNLEKWIENPQNSRFYNELARNKFIVQIVIALLYLYESQIIHRDLKPSNILIDKDSNIKIADFSEAIMNNNVIGHKSGRGTPRYQAPETKRGIYFPKCDVFSFGVILYTIITEDLNENITSNVSYIYIHDMIQRKNKNVCKYVSELIFYCLNEDIEARCDIKYVYNQLYFNDFTIFESIPSEDIVDPMKCKYGKEIIPEPENEAI